MKTTLIAVLCICFSKVSGQIKNVYSEFIVVSLVYKKDTFNCAFPQVIQLTKFGTTPITSLWCGNKEYGVKLELLKSSVALQDEVVLSKCFYIKEGNAWKVIYKAASLVQGIVKGDPCDFVKGREWVNGSEGAEDFNVTFIQLAYGY